MNYLTIEEVAEKLRMTVGTARNRLSRGDAMPPSVRIGRRRLFPSDELDRWVMTKLVSNDEVDYVDDWHMHHPDRK